MTSAPPVGHDIALVSPLAPQDHLAKLIIIVPSHSVYLVVRGHDILRVSGFDAYLKALEIDFTQRTLGEARIVVNPVGLLIIAGEVFGAGRDTGV